MREIYKLLGLIFFSSALIAQNVTLTVNNGTGAGNYFEGDTVYVFSDIASSKEVFTKWSGNGIEFLTNPDEWYSKLIIPNDINLLNLELTANFDYLPDDAKVKSELIALFGENDGLFIKEVLKEVNFAIPENPKGLVMLFHGTGGRGVNMFERYETITLIKDLFYSGYGSISIDCNESTFGDQDGDGKIRWKAAQAIQQNFENNIDLYNLRALKDTLISRFNLQDDFPFFAYGVSNGANFGDLVSAELDFKASAHNTGNGNASLYALHPNVKPVIWLQASNDQNSNADPELAFNNYETLIERGICSEWHWVMPVPLFEKRFMRSLNNITHQISKSTYQRFFDFHHLVDDEGFIIVNEILKELPSDFFSPLNLNNSQIDDVSLQLKASNADHGATGDFNKQIIRFFEKSCLISGANNSIETLSAISIYPNPANDFLLIEGEGVQSIKIFSLTGELLKTVTFDSYSIMHKVNLESLISGTYFIIINTENSNRAEKFIVD